MLCFSGNCPGDAPTIRPTSADNKNLNQDGFVPSWLNFLLRPTHVWGGDDPTCAITFSEEKNKTRLISPPLPAIRPWPVSVRPRKIKSLLVLFFRKEHASFQ
jgi:hypothetical protein